ncbi:MAG TPA: nitrophenyl compound nitroreductase subunit ArsF family protein [Synergistaceae bacterium]|nr:nitrophenyl compound nitroreductase subunit ArsF family protein [Synergistaceae bacterium]
MVPIKRSAGIFLLLFSLFSFAYALHTTLRDLQSETGKSAEELLGQEHNRVLYVLYLHGNAKCITCKDILTRTRETLDSAFGNFLEKGTLVYREINVDLPENSQYAATFEYFATSVVLALYEEGTLKKWKNLDKVWDFANDPEAFDPYFKKELETMLKEGGLTP